MLSGRIRVFDPDASDEEHDRDWFSALTDPEEPSRRGCTLAITSALQNMLIALLNNKLPSTVDKKPFKSQIDLAMTHGFLEEREEKSCQIIREVRNCFAHQETANFMNAKVKALSRELKNLNDEIAGDDAYWIFYQAVRNIALPLRGKMRVAGLIHNS